MYLPHSSLGISLGKKPAEVYQKNMVRKKGWENPQHSTGTSLRRHGCHWPAAPSNLMRCVYLAMVAVKGVSEMMNIHLDMALIQ